MTYRKFPSRYGWTRPRNAWGWLGYSAAIRLGLVAVICWALATNWRG